MSQSSEDTLSNVMESVLEAMRVSGAARVGFQNADELLACVLPIQAAPPAPTDASDTPGPADLVEVAGTEGPAEQTEPQDPSARDAAKQAEPLPRAALAYVLVGLQLSDLDALSTVLALSGLGLRQVREPSVPMSPGDYVLMPTWLPEVFVAAVVPLDALLSLSAAPGVLSIEPTGFGVTHG